MFKLLTIVILFAIRTDKAMTETASKVCDQTELPNKNSAFFAGIELALFFELNWRAKNKIFAFLHHYFSFTGNNQWWAFG